MWTGDNLDIMRGMNSDCSDPQKVEGLAVESQRGNSSARKKGDRKVLLRGRFSPSLVESERVHAR